MGAEVISKNIISILTITNEQSTIDGLESRIQ